MDYLLPSVWLFVAGLCSICFLLVKRNVQLAGKKVPPGSMGFPIIGETLQFFAPHKITSPEPFFAKRIPRYGKLFKTHILGKPTIMATDPEDIRFILQNEGKLFRPAYPVSLKNTVGEWTFIFSEIDYWRKQRQVLMGFMHGKLKDSFLTSVEESVLEVMRPWKTSSIVQISHQARTLTFSVMIKELLSCSLKDEGVKDMLKDFTLLAEGSIGLPISLPGTRYRKAVMARQRILASLTSIIEKRKESGIAYNDFLAKLIADGGYNHEQTLDFLINIIFGGFDTTSGGLTLLVKFVKDHQQVLKQLQDEHETIKKNKKGKNLTWEDYMSMTFTNQVILETLRFGNEAYALFRRALEDVQIGEYIIPKGWDAIVSTFAVHSDPAIYTDPFKFNPWRWETTSTKYFFGFGGGPRKCPGSELAKLDVSIFLHHLITRFSWRDVEPQEVVIDAAVKVPNGLLIELTEI